MSREATHLLDDIIDAAHAIQEALRRLEGRAIDSDRLLFDAILKNLMVIGEAVKHLPEEFRAQRQEIPWRDVAAMRDRLIHGYFLIEPSIVEQVVSHDLPRLYQQLKELRASL